VKKYFKNRYFLVGGVAQAAKCLPSKCKALSSNPIKKYIYIYPLKLSLIKKGINNRKKIWTPQIPGH
jgi:hypothetical protein